MSFPATVSPMRRLLPAPTEPVDPYDAYRVPAGQPFLRVNMVSSADGAATDERGRSGGLTGEGDQELFRTLRALADGIVIGAGTVRIEGYGPHRLRADLAERRRADGRTEPAPIVVVTRSLDLDFTAPLFTEAAVPTVVLTCDASPAGRRADAAKAARVLVAGDHEVDLAEGLRLLREELGLSHLLCEGGPTLNVPLFSADLVDELCLTLSPLLVGGSGPRILPALLGTRHLELSQLCEQDAELYLRYALRRA